MLMGLVMDNVDVAVLTKVNELAVRHNLKPYDFVAVFRAETDPAGITQYVLDYELPASGNALREERYDKMLSDIGIIQGDDAKLTGTCEHIIDALDNALEHAPRSRSRF